MSERVRLRPPPRRRLRTPDSKLAQEAPHHEFSVRVHAGFIFEHFIINVLLLQEAHRRVLRVVAISKTGS